METRRLHALAREKAVDRLAVHAQHPTDAHGIETSVVNQATNCLGVNSELIGDVPNAHELRLSVRGGHAAINLPQEPVNCVVQLA